MNGFSFTPTNTFGIVPTYRQTEAQAGNVKTPSPPGCDPWVVTLTPPMWPLHIPQACASQVHTCTHSVELLRRWAFLQAAPPPTACPPLSLSSPSFPLTALPSSSPRRRRLSASRQIFLFAGRRPPGKTAVRDGQGHFSLNKAVCIHLRGRHFFLTREQLPFFCRSHAGSERGKTPIGLLLGSTGRGSRWWGSSFPDA